MTKCFHAGGIYVFTQLCKMLILTFFPETINANPVGFNFIGVSRALDELINEGSLWSPITMFLLIRNAFAAQLI